MPLRYPLQFCSVSIFPYSITLVDTLFFYPVFSGGVRRGGERRPLGRRFYVREGWLLADGRVYADHIWKMP